MDRPQEDALKPVKNQNAMYSDVYLHETLIAIANLPTAYKRIEAVGLSY